MKQILIVTLLFLISACGSTPTRYNHTDKRTTTITQDSIVFENDKIDSPSMFIVSVSPNYPAEAYRNLVTGNVELRFIVNEGGIPINIEVLNSNPTGVFDREAVRALSKWKFKPAFHNNEVVLVNMKQVITFKIEDKKK